MTTHITYKTAKALKEFLGDNHPRPLTGKYWTNGADNEIVELTIYGREHGPTESFDIPQYQLHDLLSRHFCEAFFKVYGPHEFKNGWSYEDDYDVAVVLMERYYSGGLPAVEQELMKMMEAK